jgi:L-iditol 2-dehydrogenase
MAKTASPRRADIIDATGEMTAAVLHGPRDLRLEQVPVPVPSYGEVLVRVTAVGVCGSDVHYFEHGRIGDFIVDQPLVLGHETAGVVVAVGPGASPARVGERVSLEPGTSCGRCLECRAGRYNLCSQMRFHGTPPVNGTLAEYVCVPGDLAFRVPDALSDNATALLEPLSVAIHATRKAGVRDGDAVLVSGAGPIGLLMAQVAAVRGATTVTVTDVSQARLEAAAELGATEVRLAGHAPADGRFDAYIDCSGAPSAIRAGICSVRPGGAAVLVGMGPDDLQLPLSIVQQRELVVTGVFRYANTWPAAISLASSGRIRLDELVTHEFALGSVYEALASGTDPARIKGIVKPVLA